MSLFCRYANILTPSSPPRIELFFLGMLKRNLRNFTISTQRADRELNKNNKKEILRIKRMKSLRENKRIFSFFMRCCLSWVCVWRKQEICGGGITSIDIPIERESEWGHCLRSSKHFCCLWGSKRINGFSRCFMNYSWAKELLNGDEFLIISMESRDKGWQVRVWTLKFPNLTWCHTKLHKFRPMRTF